MEVREKILRQVRSMNVMSEKTLEILVEAAQKAKISGAALELEMEIVNLKKHFSDKRTFFESLKKGNTKVPGLIEELDNYIQEEVRREKEVLRCFEE